MTPEQGCEAARYNLVGYVVSMGVEHAELIRVDEAISQRGGKALVQDFPFKTLAEYDLWRRVGFAPSAWARAFLSLVPDASGDEIRWLHGGKCGLDDAISWAARRMSVREA